MISQDLTSEEQTELLLFLDNNNDAFAWKTSDFMGMNKSIIEHMLHVNPFAKPWKQKLRKMSDEKIAAAKAKVTGCRLHTSPIPNMVGKHSHLQKEEWRMENVHKLYWFKQVLPKGWFSPIQNWQSGWLSYRLRDDGFARKMRV
jgi:hypothetical protein